VLNALVNTSSFASIVAVTSLSLACASSSSPPAGGSGSRDAGESGDAGVSPDSGAPVGAPVGTRRIEITTPSGRTLPVQLWYPAARGTKNDARPLGDIEPPGALRDQLSALVEAAPEHCTSKTMLAADAPAVAPHARPLPLVLFSHCLNCLRFSELTVSEALAREGFVVAAPDHVGNTLYDQLANASTGLTPDVLTVRADDIRAVLGTLLDAGAAAVPDGLRGELDADRVGMFGHSFGSVTTGLVLQSDARVKAGVMMAAPPETPLFPAVTLVKMTQPALFFLAQEDHSVGDVGNTYIRSNFQAYGAPAWLLEVADAGHWSFSDICGIAKGFEPGCGQATRQADASVSFTYVDNDVARELAARYVSAFFRAELLGDAAAAQSLSVASPADVVTVTQRN
jgi:predicted dienelactone hydrolase